MVDEEKEKKLIFAIFLSFFPSTTREFLTFHFYLGCDRHFRDKMITCLICCANGSSVSPIKISLLASASVFAIRRMSVLSGG